MTENPHKELNFMNKLTKIIVGATMAASIAATAGILAGCSGGGTSSDKTGEAYAVTHSANFVGYAKITVNGDSVKDLTLTEVCLPTQVKAAEGVAEADVVGNYYKTVSYGSVTLTYDEADGYKTSDGKKFVDYLNESEANCKAYYEAVTTNSVKVTVGGQQKTDIMNNATLSKEENGYWTRTDKDGNSYSRWKMNRDETVKYVKANGVSKLTSLTKTSDKVADLKEDKEVSVWTDGTVNTGATWNDLNPADKGGKVYSSYAELIIRADNAAK